MLFEISPKSNVKLFDTISQTNANTTPILVRPPHYSIRDHALICNSDINLSDFLIVTNVRHEIPLYITESIFILQNSPKLNDLGKGILKPSNDLAHKLMKSHNTPT